METKIQKWGNSLAVRLPKEFAKQLALLEGSTVLVTQEDRRRIVIKHAPRVKTSLAELVRNIKDNETHRETEWGIPQGKEVW